MGTILASSIINKAATTLFDINGAKWNRKELLGWVNDAQRQIAIVDPTATNVTVAMQLAAGTRQSIPADGWTLLDVYRNMGTSGTVPGASLRVVLRRHLDLFNPSWHSATQVTAPTEYLYDPNDKTKFWVNPPSDGSGYVEVNYSQTPPDLPAETSAISVNDVLEPMILDYVLYRACEKDGADSPGPEMAAKYKAAFVEGMSAKDSMQAATNPNMSITRQAPPASGGG